MKKINFLLAVLAVVLAFSSCSKSETYADQLERENDAIHAFIVKKGINVITEAQFTKQGNTTDTTKNQYVLFPNTGIYMQIVEKGTGEVIKKERLRLSSAVLLNVIFLGTLFSCQISILSLDRRLIRCL